MNTQQVEVVVIGAGLGGLSAAVYLAKAGKKVLVLEHHTVPGGYAHEFRRGKYRFEVALHALDGVAPGGWASPVLHELGVLEQIPFKRLDPFYTARFPKHEIIAYADIVRYEAELVKNFPHERKGIHALIADMVKTYWQVRRFGAEGEAGIRPPVEQLPSEYPNMLATMSMSWDVYMNQFIEDIELKAVFSTLWGYYGLPPEKLNAACFIFPWGSYHLSGAYFPQGGSMAISRALEATLRQHGGEIRYRQTVNKIDLMGGRAVAVETENGMRVEADVVISNANAPDTLIKFVGRENLPIEYVDKVEAVKPSLSNLVVYLGLDCDLRAEGWHHHEMFWSDSYDIGAEYEASVKGDFATTGIGLTYYDLSDPGCAPAGSSILNILSLADWNSDNQWGTGGNLENYSDNPQYKKIKNAAADVLITRVEKLIPNLRKHIRYMEVGTPITNWRYSRNTGGAIYGSEQSVDNMYFNRLQAITPIPNLFLAGAWTFAGGMSAALISGRETSKLVLGYIDGVEVVLMTSPKEVSDRQLSVGTMQPSGFGEARAVKSKQVSGASETLLSAETAKVFGIMGVIHSGETHQLTETEPCSCTRESLPILDYHLPIMKAIGSNREVNLNAIGTPAVLLFHTQETAEQAAAVNFALRARSDYKSCDSLLIANIVDLRSVPKLFHNFAEKAMKESYEKAAASLPVGANPQEYVLILPDWDGSVTKAFGLKDTNKTAALAVLNETGKVSGTYQGEAAETNALALLKRG